MIVNNTAVFRCIATDKPVVDITWLRNGSVLHRPRLQTNITYDKNCSDDNSNNQCVLCSTLQLFNTQPADSGQYVCNVSNELFSSAQPVYLTVLGK